MLSSLSHLDARTAARLFFAFHSFFPLWLSRSFFFILTFDLSASYFAVPLFNKQTSGDTFVHPPDSILSFAT
jgi:hypothetical protein